MNNVQVDGFFSSEVPSQSRQGGLTYKAGKSFLVMLNTLVMVAPDHH